MRSNQSKAPDGEVKIQKLNLNYSDRRYEELVAGERRYHAAISVLVTTLLTSPTKSGNAEKPKIESIFAGLEHNWQSFVNNRLP